MAMETTSGKVIFSVFALILVLLGLSKWVSTSVGYIPTLLLGAAGLILYLELGVKKFTALSEMDEFDTGNWITFSVATFMIIYAIILLPFIPIAAPAWIVTIASIAMIISGLFVVKETYF